VLRKKLFWWVYAFFMGVLTYLSLTPISAEKLPQIPFFDKIAHLGFYFLVTFLFFLSWSRFSFFFSGTKRVLIGGVLFHVFYGMIIEIIQAYLIPGRYGEWEDALANTLGVLAAAFLFYLYFYKKQRLN